MDEADRQIFNVQLDRSGLVIFSEFMYPGWKAWVDEKESPLFTADHLLRSVVLTPGRHEVEFRFEPVWFKPLIGGFALWFLLTLGAFYFFRSKGGSPA
jgi:hypothetical protein